MNFLICWLHILSASFPEIEQNPTKQKEKEKKEKRKRYALFFFSFPLFLLFSFLHFLLPNLLNTYTGPLSFSAPRRQPLHRPYGIVVHYRLPATAPTTVIPTIHLPRQLLIVISLTHPNTNTKYQICGLQSAAYNLRPTTCDPRPATHDPQRPAQDIGIYLRIVYLLCAECLIPVVARRQHVLPLFASTRARH